MVPNNHDSNAAFKENTSESKPSDLLLYYNGVATVKCWGSDPRQPVWCTRRGIAIHRLVELEQGDWRNQRAKQDRKEVGEVTRSVYRTVRGSMPQASV